MTQIIPAILTDSSVKFKDLVLRLESYAKRIHVDIADGVFVPNKTIRGYEEIKDVENSVKFDVHLMVVKPQDILKEWLHTYADRIIIHVESECNLGELISEIHQNKKQVGLALNPETDTSRIEPFVDKVDFFQFMTVHPGFQGGQFVQEVVNKVAMFRDKYKGIMIMCDGGITPVTTPGLVKAGASVLVSGSYIIKSPDIDQAIEELKKSCTIL